MSRLVEKWRKTVSGCKSKKSESLLDNAEYMCSNEELEFNHKNACIDENNNQNTNPNSNQKLTIYNEYDNLHHLNQKFTNSNTETSSSTAVKILSDKTNQNSSSKIGMSFKRVFSSAAKVAAANTNTVETAKKSVDLTSNYCELFNGKRMIGNTLKLKAVSKELLFEDEDKSKDADNEYYCEINENSNLIEAFNEEDVDVNFKRSSHSKTNLFKFENEDLLTSQHTNTTTNTTNTDNSQVEQDITELKDLSSFINQSEAFHWYLNEIFERIFDSIKKDETLTPQDKIKRDNLCRAHLLYAKNFYEMRLMKSIQATTDANNCLEGVHPCLIVLSCLIDSDAVRIVETHTCKCDTYMYFFSTKVKFCAWKSKMFVILKRPKRSSIDRLTFIEDLSNCHKMIKKLI